MEISSGADFLAAIKVQEEISDSAVVATVFPDDNKRYLSTDLLREERSKPDYLSEKVELLDYSAFRRVCHTCCDFNNCTERLANVEAISALDKK